MFVRARAQGIVLAAVAVFLTGCAPTGAPSQWLPEPEATQVEAHGAWIRVEHGTGDDRVRTEGEFLAVEEDTVFILTAQDTLGRVVAMPKGKIEKARLGTFDPNMGGLVVWTLFGTLSTVSHGIGLILTAPVWIITGSIVTGIHSRSAIEETGDMPWDTWPELKVYARFPQGLPDNIDRASLKPRVSGSRPRRGSTQRR